MIFWMLLFLTIGVPILILAAAVVYNGSRSLSRVERLCEDDDDDSEAWKRR